MSPPSLHSYLLTSVFILYSFIRYVLELLFRRLLLKLQDNETLKNALNNSSVISKTVVKNLSGLVAAVRMSSVNDALLDDVFRTRAWESLGIPADTPFPSLPGELLYGDLSAEIHHPMIKEVYLSDGELSSIVSLFFVAAANALNHKVVYYSDAEAARAEEM